MLTKRILDVYNFETDQNIQLVTKRKQTNTCEMRLATYQDIFTVNYFDCDTIKPKNAFYFETDNAKLFCFRYIMTSERDKCGLTSLLPISCRDRAEAFAKSLQSRLSSLGGQDGSSDERSWLGSRENTVSLTSQPLHNPDTERYLALEVLESPGSPQVEFFDEVTGKNGEVRCNGLTRHLSGDSDSEVFYDLDEDVIDPQPYTNGLDHSSELDSEETFVQPSTSEESSKETVTEIDDDNDSDEVIPRVRRCSSLKTGKTPPGTPSRKKIVRFADVLGLDLADVRTFLDEIPKVPKSAYNDLSDVDLSDSSDLSSFGSKYHGIRSDRILVPLFEQPAGLPNFLDRVRDNQVCLENALVDDPILFSIKGTVRVRNLDFHKSVHVRYSLDSWKTFADVQAVYLNNSCDGFSDRFAFTLYAHTLSVGQKLEFACRFQCKGSQYWDNNGGKNYCFQCLPSTASTTTTPLVITHGHSDWGASFY